MLIKKVRLNNIRSYINDEINLDKGITLLAGNIGSGKSTILLAIDFALFGLRKGYLSGSSLLRNGEQNGYVELTFEIDSKEITIRRTLKRTQNSISQDYGYLKINENEKEYAAVELKQFIINTLNYPKEYLTKSKYFIYNYTIYTPQEDMKQILLGEREHRLDTIRKVFGIDRYQRIKENSKIINDFLKSKKRELSLIADNYHNQVEEKIKKENKLTENKQIAEECRIKLGYVLKIVSDKNEEIKVVEESIKDLNNDKKEAELKTLEINYKNNQIKKNDAEINRLEKDIEKLISEVKDEILIDNNIKIDKENQFKKLNDELNDLKSKEKVIALKKISSSEVKKSIEKLDICPTCLQKVSEEYKDNIISKENEINYNLEKEKVEINNKIEQINKEIYALKGEIDLINKKEGFIEISKLKKINLEEKIKKTEDLKTNNKNLNIEIIKLNEIIVKIQLKISGFLDIEKIYNSLKEELIKNQSEQRDFEIKKGIIEHEIILINKDLEKINKELDFIKETKKKLEKNNLLQNFFENKFINILEAIEKRVLIKIKNDFDNFFQKWFYMLVESESIKVKLDEEFSPIIEIAGHEIEYINLSGGEKTAAALAYRLALNQIINTFVSEIKTKDVLILDEPTDGFSAEQLDRLRFVLEELNINQIIIVSHESKIESFVDRIIKLQKYNHITQII